MAKHKSKPGENIVRPGANPDAMRADLERRRSSAASPQHRGNRRLKTRRDVKRNSMQGW